jgi:CHASE3 domain sensor protein
VAKVTHLMSGDGPAAAGSPRLPLALQLFAGVGALVLLVAVAVVIGVILVRGLGHGATELTGRDVQFARAVDAAALRSKAMANDERGFLLSGRDPFLERFELRAVRVRASFAAASRAAADGGERAAVRDAGAVFERWVRAVRAEVKLYKSGREEAAISKALGSTRDLRYDYEQLLREAQRLGASGIESGAESVSTASSQSIVILIVYLGVALLIAAAIAWWLIRTILRPVYALLAIFAEPGATERLVERYSRAASGRSPRIPR